MTVLSFPRAVIYDWDNTLVDTWPVIIRAMNATLSAMGQPIWSVDESKKRIKKSLRDSFPDLFGSEWEKAKDIFYESIRQNHLNQLSLLDGADDLTYYLYQKKIPQFILSNKTHFLLQAEVEHLGWVDRFFRIVGADVAPQDKPAVQAVHYTLQGSHINPDSDIWFLGDSTIDVECALKSGLTPVAVSGYAERNIGEDNGPKAYFISPRHVLEMLQTNFK